MVQRRQRAGACNPSNLPQMSGAWRWVVARIPTNERDQKTWGMRQPAEPPKAGARRVSRPTGGPSACRATIALDKFQSTSVLRWVNAPSCYH
jgi:hypothetical protein